MNVLNFKIVDASKTIVAKFDYEDSEGKIIRDVRLMKGDKGPWIAWPSREYKDAEGKTKYFSYIHFIASERKAEIESELKKRINAFLPINNSNEVPF